MLALALCVSVTLLGGCLHRRSLSPSDPAHFQIAIRELLKRDEPTEGYY